MQLVKLHILTVVLSYLSTSAAILNRGECMQKLQKDKYKHLGLNITYYRKEKGLSQSKLAELVNISRTHMSRIETADCAVSLDVVFAICDTLSIKPSELFNFRD